MRRCPIAVCVAVCVATMAVAANAGEWNYYRGETRHYFVPTGPSRPYYGYIDPSPPRVPFGAMFDPTRTTRGRQYIIETPSVRYPNGAQVYYPYRLY